MAHPGFVTDAQQGACLHLKLRTSIARSSRDGDAGWNKASERKDRGLQLRDIVVVGASAGGIEVLCRFLADLPRGFRARIFIVQHLGESEFLPEVLARCTALPVIVPHDVESTKLGRIYLAPPNHHMLIENGRIRLSKGPRENRHRPSVDALFRSAARSYEQRVLAVVLSGALDDGSTGAFVVKERGGTVVVQEPGDALVPDMPRNALRAVQVDHCVRAADLGKLITKLVTQRVLVPGSHTSFEGKKKKQPPQASVPEEMLVPIVCPDCCGPLHYEARTGEFNCEVGHSYSLSGLSFAHTETLERTLWTSIRALKERAALQEQLADQANRRKDPALAGRFRETAEGAERDIVLLREILDRIE